MTRYRIAHKKRTSSLGSDTPSKKRTQPVECDPPSQACPEPMDCDTPRPSARCLFTDMLKWPKSLLGANKSIVEPSLICKLKRVVSPLKRYVAAGGLSDDAPTVRQKTAALKCPVMLSPWRAKKLWKILLTKSRFVQSFALPVEGEERPPACSPAALDLFPLKALVSGWEPFIKNLFTVARFKDLPKLMWNLDESQEGSLRCGRSRDGSRSEISRSRRSSWESRGKSVTGGSPSPCSRSSSLDAAKSRPASASPECSKRRRRTRSKSTHVPDSPSATSVVIPSTSGHRNRRPERRSKSVCRRPVCSVSRGMRTRKPRSVKNIRRKCRPLNRAPKRGRKRR